MRIHTFLFIFSLSLNDAEPTSMSYDVYLQLSQFRTSVQVIPYRLYELRWEIECTTDDRQPITKYPTAFSIDDSRLIFFDPFSQQIQPHVSQDQQNFVYVREVAEMAVVCFRLYYRNELALEDCLVVDVRASDFADVRYSTKTRAHGNALTYQAQITPSNGLYLLLTKNDNNETFLANTTSHHRLTSVCMATTALASIEAVVILIAALSALYLFVHKTGRFSLAKLRRKRRSLGTGRLQKIHMPKPKISNPQSQQPQIIIKPVDLSVPRLVTPEQHYRAPSASSADSGLSTMSVKSSSIHSRNQTKKAPVVIYDDPPEYASNTTTKLSSVQDYLSEVWRRRPGHTPPPPPPIPDYGGKDEPGDMQSISQSLAYDIYAALEDPNNWDPPEQLWADHDPRGHTHCESNDKS